MDMSEAIPPVAATGIYVTGWAFTFRGIAKSEVRQGGRRDTAISFARFVAPLWPILLPVYLYKRATELLTWNIPLSDVEKAEQLERLEREVGLVPYTVTAEDVRDEMVGQPTAGDLDKLVNMDLVTMHELLRLGIKIRKGLVLPSGLVVQVPEDYAQAGCMTQRARDNLLDAHMTSILSPCRPR